MIIKENNKKDKKHQKHHLCLCESCGIEFERIASYHRFDECLKCSNIRGGLTRRTHGETNANSRLHVTWSNMKSRCLNKSNRKYPTYGGNGVTICNEWLIYEPFMRWAIHSGYNDNLTLDRVDNMKGYCPSNCRFVDVSTQNANKLKSNKNKTGYIGVSLSRCGTYRSNVNWHGKQINLGSYQTVEKAAFIRDRYVINNNLPHTLNFDKEKYQKLCKQLEREAA